MKPHLVPDQNGQIRVDVHVGIYCQGWLLGVGPAFHVRISVCRKVVLVPLSVAISMNVFLLAST